jgi:hypothetical protein
MGPSNERCCDVHEVQKDLLIPIPPFERIRSMPSTPPQTGRVVIAGIAAVTLVVVVGAVAFGAGRQPAAAPTPTPVSTPSPVPTSPVQPATPAPTSTPSDGPTVVVLDTANENGPSVVVDDQSGKLADVLAGHAGDGMSVRWNDAIVDQIDPRTIRVTWVGFPGAEEVVLTITADRGAPVLIFDQKAPYANTDALGADRVLVLTFEDDVDADEVEVGFPSLEASF